jgi:hypothetical protein
MTSAPQPPRLARLLVRARLRGGERTDVESDLAELFEERVERLDLHRARRRYWRDAISLWLQPRRATILRTPTSHGVRRRPMLGADIRWAWRSIRSRPTASIAVVVVLAVGVGLAAAMFALADPYVLRALPYPRPSELVLISPHDPLPTIQKGKLVEPTDNLTVADWRARVHLFSAMAGIGDRHTIQVDRNGVLTTLRTADVSAGFFAIMGLPMPSGVPWRVAPDQHAERPIAIVDDHATQIGMPLTSPDGERWRVAVLLPATFVFPQASGERVTALVPLADEHIQYSHIHAHPAGAPGARRHRGAGGRRCRATARRHPARVSHATHGRTAVGRDDIPHAGARPRRRYRRPADLPDVGGQHRESARGTRRFSAA